VLSPFPKRFALVLSLMLASASALATDVIANNSVPVARLSLTALRNLYMLRQTVWPNGQRVQLFVLPDDHPVHEAFAKETLGIYPYRLRQIWDRLSFSGMAVPPVEVQNENEMRARVIATPGAIGYVNKGSGNDNYKILPLD
jgi:hypothetical protein